MGGKTFSEMLSRYAPNSYYWVSLESFRGQRLAVDLNHLLHQMKSGGISIVLGMTDPRVEKPNLQSIHRETLRLLWHQLSLLLNHGITPICILDSKAHPMKTAELLKRREQKTKQRQSLQQLEMEIYQFGKLDLLPEYIKQYRGLVEVESELVDSVIEILKEVGLPLFRSEDFHLETRDAEGIGAHLCVNGYCFGVLTKDSDVHLYGAGLAVVEINGDSIKVRSLEAILKQLGMTFSEFQDFCILCGTDYNCNLPKVGVVRSYDKIKKYGSLEKMEADHDLSILRYPEVRKIFQSSLEKCSIPESSLDLNREKWESQTVRVLACYGIQ